MPKLKIKYTKHIKDENNNYIVICKICGKENKLKVWQININDYRCVSCAAKESYKINRKPSLYKYNIKTEDLIREYSSGKSLREVSIKYNLSEWAISLRIKKVGGYIRTRKEAIMLTNKKYGNIEKAKKKTKELCVIGEWGKRISARHQGIPIEEWKDFKCMTKDKKILSTYQYKNWRKQVFERDNYTCGLCNQRGGNLEAHHIFCRKNYPEFIYNIKNGITLCRVCHKQTFNKELELADSFFFLINIDKNSLLSEVTT